MDTLSSILKDTPVPVSKISSAAPAGIEPIIDRCLEKKRDDRYASAAEVRAELETIISELAASPAARQGRRRRILIATFALIMAGALALRIFGPPGWRGGRAAGSVAGPVRSLAVLPLKPIGGDGPDSILGLGIADTIITKVSQIGSLTVRPTSAVRKYSSADVDSLEAARQLEVEAVLDGTVQHAGDRLKVSVNLLRVSDGTSLMAESFEMGFTEIFAIQDRVAREVASRLKVTLSPAERERLGKKYTESAQAYEHYLKGEQAFEQRDVWIGSKPEIESAIASFARAIEADPNYSLAHAELAHAYVWMGLYVERQTGWIEKAERELDEAARLDPMLAEAHVVRGDILWSAFKGWRIAEAVREFRTAQSLNPSIGHTEAGTVYYHLGLEEPAMRELNRAMEIDPHGRNILVRVREGLILLGHYDEAIAMSGPSLSATSRTMALIYKGRLDEAEASQQEELAQDPSNPYTMSMGALLLALRGKFEESESRFPEIVERAGTGRAFHHIAHARASVYALEGKAREAVEWLKKTAETGMPNFPLFARDPHLDKIRSDTAFVKFMSDLKPEWEGYRREFELE